MKNKQLLIDHVKKLIKTDGYPRNETNIEDWINEGETDDMTPKQIAKEWDEISRSSR